MVQAWMLTIEAVLIGAFGGAALRQVAAVKLGKPHKGTKGSKPEKPTRVTL